MQGTAQPGSLILGAAAAGAVQVAQGYGQEVSGAQGRDCTGPAEADGRAEFRELFVSLVDPAGLLDMERCGEIAGRMEEAASRSGYGAGARMASILGDVFADVANIVNRPVEEGALYYTTSACREMRPLLYGTAKSYREGRTASPSAGWRS